MPPFMDSKVVPEELQLDWGMPVDAVLRRVGDNVFAREWSGGTASFDCSMQQGKLVSKTDDQVMTPCVMNAGKVSTARE